MLWGSLKEGRLLGRALSVVRRVTKRSTMPLVARVLSTPSAAFSAVEERGKGYGLLLFFLAVELCMVAPTDVAAHLAVATYEPLGGLAGLYALYVGYALAPLVGVFAGGIGLHVLRRRSTTPIEIYAAASVVAYAWVPHVLWVALGSTLGAAGLDHPLLGHHRLATLQGWVAVTKLLLELGPVAFLASLALRLPAAGSANAGSDASAGASRRRRWASAAAAGLLIAGGLTAAGWRTAENWHRTRPALPGDPVPAFAVRTLDGKTEVSAADLRGRVTLIDFWATWCGPCVAAMPGLAELHTDLGAKGLSLLSINVEAGAAATVRRFVDAKRLPFEVFLDNGNAQRSFRIRTYPTYLIVDRNARIRDIFVGSTSMATLRSRLQELIGPG